jgi:hypothetical protein
LSIIGATTGKSTIGVLVVVASTVGTGGPSGKGRDVSLVEVLGAVSAGEDLSSGVDTETPITIPQITMTTTATNDIKLQCRRFLPSIVFVSPTGKAIVRVDGSCPSVTTRALSTTASESAVTTDVVWWLTHEA